MVNVGNDNTSRNGKVWREVKLTLLCGWEYIDTEWVDRMGWADADCWVDEVQSEIFVWYPEDESWQSFLEDNELEECGRPRRIYHYNEEKDGWEILKEECAKNNFKESVEGKEKIIDWYMNHYLDDSLGEELNPDVTFEDCVNTLQNGTDFYKLIGVGDSVIRERLFHEIDKRFDVDSYELWINS